MANDQLIQVLAPRDNEDLTDKIFVTAAYNSQVDYIPDYFHGPHGCWRNNSYAARCVKKATINNF